MLLVRALGIPRGHEDVSLLNPARDNCLVAPHWHRATRLGYARDGDVRGAWVGVHIRCGLPAGCSLGIWSPSSRCVLAARLSHSRREERFTTGRDGRVEKRMDVSRARRGVASRRGAEPRGGTHEKRPSGDGGCHRRARRRRAAPRGVQHVRRAVIRQLAVGLDERTRDALPPRALARTGRHPSHHHASLPAHRRQRAHAAERRRVLQRQHLRRRQHGDRGRGRPRRLCL